MPESAKFRVGLQSVRELEIEVDDQSVALAAIDAALTSGDAIAWITDGNGVRHGIAVGKLGFLEVEVTTPKQVGFGS